MAAIQGIPQQDHLASLMEEQKCVARLDQDTRLHSAFSCHLMHDGAAQRDRIMLNQEELSKLELDNPEDVKPLHAVLFRTRVSINFC